MNQDQVMTQRAELRIPAFGNIPEISLSLTYIKEGERRLVESQFVNGATYSELEYSFNEGYREAKKNLSTIMYQKEMAEKAIRKSKSEYLLDEYQDFLRAKKIKDSTDIRESFLETKEDYVKAMDRLSMLRAMECLMEGKLKSFENTCRTMRKEMDIQLRSGSIDNNKYIR